MSRIYLITDSLNEVKHLVRAANQAQALRRVTACQFEACVATQDVLVSMLGNGAQVIDSEAVPAVPAGV